MKTIHIGIDLGTTNSAIASFDGEAVSVIPNSFGENLTPSIVRIDRRGNLMVGRQAARYLETDPANTRSEFKRLMGTDVATGFAASGLSLLAEELSARVIMSLLSDASDALGFTPRAAVISTPALFELPQNHATMRAGKIGGLQEVLLIQEPVASAISAGWREDTPGLWLIFDLGGGTLDISLLETREGMLRVMDHSGDNFLGGKDFDNVLADWALDRLRQEYDLPDIKSPSERRAFLKLKNACEQVKIELSRAERSAIVIPELCIDGGGNPVDVDLEITRGEFEKLIAPLADRALSICLSVIEHCRVSADEIGRVVFVGGPTMTACIRTRIGEAFGGRIAPGIDPMTAVVRGAALYAATAGLDATPANAGPRPLKGMAVRIEHLPVTSDLEPFVVGRFLPGPGEQLPAAVRMRREDGFTGPDAAVGSEGSFVLQASLQRYCRNVFTLAATDAAGREIPLATPRFAIVHGVSIADPPLSRSVGVALADDSVHVYFPKGTGLPARKTFVHKTVKSVSAGGGGASLSVPIVQGEFYRAHRNCLIGSLEIDAVGRDLPVGSRIEVTLSLDRSGQMHARADIPSTGKTFDNIIHILIPTASLETLEEALKTARSRADHALKQVFRAGDARSARNGNQVPALLVEAKRSLEAACGGDYDAGQRLRRLILEIEGTLDAVDQALEWPELVQEANEKIEVAVYWVSARGTSSEQNLLDQAITEARSAIDSGDALELDRRVKTIRRLTDAAYHRDPRSPFLTFDWYSENIASATDVPRAAALLDEGREHYRQGDADALKSINSKLYTFFPGTEEERKRSFDSGVR